MVKKMNMKMPTMNMNPISKSINKSGAPALPSNAKSGSVPHIKMKVEKMPLNPTYANKTVC